jgi:hypothetical protein
MSYIPTAPDLKIEVAETIRAHRKQIADRTSRHGGVYGTYRNEAGRYTTAGGALVAVHATTVIRERYGIVGYSPPPAIHVEVGAEAKCHGHGCTDPEFTDKNADSWPLEEDADLPAEAVLPLIQAAREWAQAHAEKCRAQPYTDR